VQVGLVLMFRLPAFSRSVMILDALLVFLALGGARMSTRVLRNYVHTFRAQVPGMATLVVGAGDAGELAIRELRNNAGQGLRPVAVLDDDPGKLRMKIHGVEVVGLITDMPEIVDRLGVSNVLLAIPSASRARKDEILLAADALGLRCYEFWVASSLRRVTVDEDGAGNRQLMTSDMPVLVTDDSSALAGG
jgi:FlaA1/EpsC-like NDP-sugar epimerase